MYFLNIFPLEEQYLNNAKTDELIIDPRTGHITICTSAGSTYLSSSKDMEADLNGLLSLKDRFYKEYLLISDSLEDIINKFNESRENIKTIVGTLAECRKKLNYINDASNQLITLYESQYKDYSRYLYNDMDAFRTIVRENCKKVVIIENLFEEIDLLYEDVEEIRKINSTKLSEIKADVGIK